MSTNIVNQMPFLRTSRNFPTEAQPLAVEINKSYVDIANFVNARTIGIFPSNKPAMSGESWFLRNQRQQGFRQVYQFTSTGSIPHGINLNTVSYFTKPLGSFTDGTNWYGAIYASNTTIAGQVTFYISGSSIVISAGAGAPSISNGTVVLEWIANA